MNLAADLELESRKPVNEQPITLLLRQFQGGDKQALDLLVPALYPELRKLARGYFRSERSGHTLDPTALVHEAYARLVQHDHPDFRSRSHFLGLSARVMRQILIDHARTRNANKRGGGAAKASLDEALGISSDRSSDMTAIALDDALHELERKEPVKARLIEMRYFGGLTAEESAEVLELSLTEVQRHLRVAQAWLRNELDRQVGPAART
jgi:RNA polymerase sigma factor (TIGR02999 family)